MKKLEKLVVVIALAVFFMGTFVTVQAADIVKIDINKATAEELTQLKKIGPKTAENIIEYRKKNGPFKTIEDLMQVKGIGEAIFKLNKDKIIVLKASPDKDIKKQDKDKNKPDDTKKSSKKSD